MTEKGQDAIKGKRFYWLDNLRTFMIFLVVVIHASIVYDRYAIGAAWWIVMGGLALPLLNTAIPSLAKYLIVTVSTFVVSNVIISLYRKLITSPCYAIWKRYKEPMTLRARDAPQNFLMKQVN